MSHQNVDEIFEMFHQSLMIAELFHVTMAPESGPDSTPLDLKYSSIISHRVHVGSIEHRVLGVAGPLLKDCGPSSKLSNVCRETNLVNI